MGPELDLYLFPEDKGIKITAIERQTAREGGRRENRHQSSPGETFRFLKAGGGRHWVKPTDLIQQRKKTEDEEEQEDEEEDRRCCTVAAGKL